MASWLNACSGRARELALTARVFRAQEAKAIGLVTEVFPDMAALQAAAAEAAAAMAAKSPLAITGTKRVLLHSRQAYLPPCAEAHQQRSVHSIRLLQPWSHPCRESRELTG